MDINIGNPKQDTYSNTYSGNQQKSLHIGGQTHDVMTRDEKTKLLTAAHNRANENNQNRRRRRPPTRGAVRLSNTDSLSRANRVRNRLRAKMSEVMSSSLDANERKTVARSVQMQIDRVDRTIRQIRRRERAEQEEKRERSSQETRQESRRVEQQREEARRRRRNDMRPRSISIHRGFLYSANQGGFDPQRMFGPDANGVSGLEANASVSFNVAGQQGFVIATGPPPSVGGDVVDVVL
jgi:hypothetical protein